MFDTLANFSIFFFVLSAILLLLVIFEKQCLEFEDKLDAAILARKQKQAQAKNKTAKEVRRHEDRGAAKSA